MVGRSAAERFAVVGLSLVTGPKDPGVSTRALQAEAARQAIADAGLRREQVDGAIDIKLSPGSGEYPQYTDAFPRVLGLPVRMFFTVGRGGAGTVIATTAAMKFLELGMANYVVIAQALDDFSRSRQTRAEGGRGNRYAPKKGYWGKPFGDLTAVSHHSFFASRHMHEFGTTSEHFGAIAVAQRAWAQMNPLARFYGRPMTLEDHQNSPYLVWPYHLLDLCVASDGAVAFVLTTLDRARDLAKPPVEVLGVGLGEAMGDLWWEKKNYTRLAVQTAKESAFRQAGISLRDIDFAQMYDCFTAEVLFQIEDYGWAAKGEGGPWAAEGHMAPGGDMPINTSGGLLSAYHYGDLTPFSEAVLQLRGEAGERQLSRARIGLATGHGGEILSPGMCSVHSTMILGRVD